MAYGTRPLGCKHSYQVSIALVLREEKPAETLVGKWNKRKGERGEGQREGEAERGRNEERKKFLVTMGCLAFNNTTLCVQVEECECRANVFSIIDINVVEAYLHFLNRTK